MGNTCKYRQCANRTYTTNRTYLSVDCVSIERIMFAGVYDGLPWCWGLSGNTAGAGNGGEYCLMASAERMSGAVDASLGVMGIMRAVRIMGATGASLDSR